MLGYAAFIPWYWKVVLLGLQADNKWSNEWFVSIQGSHVAKTEF